VISFAFFGLGTLRWPKNVQTKDLPVNMSNDWS
jgi:hypothetical protein